MPDATTIGFSILGMKIAALDVSNNTYGTAIDLEYAQKLGFEGQMATDLLMALGQAVESLAILTHITGTLSQGLLDFAAYAIMMGVSQTSSGSAPNVEYNVDVQVGGAGYGYFGLIGKIATLQGGDIHLGFPKCQLQKLPSFDVEQNKFVLPETEVLMLAPSTGARVAARYKRHQTATAITSNFGTFFTGVFA